MNDNGEKIVNFYKHCKLCKYLDLDDSEDPCDECLNNPVNMNSERPIHFDPDPKKKISEVVIKARRGDDQNEDSI